MDWNSVANNATGLIGGVIGAIGAKKQREFEQQEAQKQREWNEQMQDKTNDWNLQMWNMTNEYNTPAAQKQRLIDAGLNPLYYGLDGSSAGNVQSAQALGFDRASMAGMSNPLQAGMESFLQSRQAAKQLELMNAQIENTRSDTAHKNEETITETKRREQMQAQIDETRQQIKNLMASESLTNTEREKMQKDLDWLDRLNEAELAAKESTAKLNDSQRSRIDALLPGEKELQHMQLADFYKKWEQIDAQIEKMAAETGLLREDIENYALNKMNNGIMGTGVSLINMWRQQAANAQKKADKEHEKETARARRNNDYQLSHGKGGEFANTIPQF